MPTTAAIRLVIADDHPVFRKGLIHSINQESCHSIQIVGEADNGENLIKEVERQRPDVALTDIHMPIMCGIDASRIITQKFSATSVIACTMLTEVENIFEMFEAGARGYLTKNSDTDEIIEAIKAVHAGGMYYCSNSPMSLIKKTGPTKYNLCKRNKDIHFSEREIEFIKLVCLEFPIKEIAGIMKVSTRRVDEYSQCIKEKTETSSFVGIALFAIKNNIVRTCEVCPFSKS